MVCTTFLNTKEISAVEDEELFTLLNKDSYIQSHYVVKERRVSVYKRFLLIFEIETYETYYDVYYRYDGTDSVSVQQLSLPSCTKEGVMNFFYGVLGGRKTNAIQN